MKQIFSKNALIWVKSLLIGLLLVGIYFPSHTLMVKQWQKNDYNYCYLIPIVVLYLIWERRQKIAMWPSEPSWKGLVLFLTGVMLIWLGELGGGALLRRGHRRSDHSSAGGLQR